MSIIEQRDEDRRDEAFERRARAAFESSVGAVDAATQSRLNRARQAAMAAATEGRRPVFGLSWRTWAPAGAVAAGLLAAVLLLRAPSAVGPAPGLAGQPPEAPAAIEMVASGADLEIVTGEEDLEFYRWVDAAAADAAGNQSG